MSYDSVYDTTGRACVYLSDEDVNSPSAVVHNEPVILRSLASISIAFRDRNESPIGFMLSGSVEWIEALYSAISKDLWDLANPDGSNVELDLPLDDDSVETNESYEFTQEGAVKFLELLNRPNPSAVKSLQRIGSTIQKESLERIGKGSVELTVSLQKDTDE